MRKKNTYFQFKQFRIEQDKTAMKVSTEACILGAYSHSDAPKAILDIGSGTGLLALMLAQRYPNSQITTIEIEENAFKQAQENSQRSIFSKQINLVYQSAQDFSDRSLEKFDMIVSNPPFYENHLLSGDKAQDGALHQETLNFEELAYIVKKQLEQTGVFWLLLPPYQMEQFGGIAQRQGLFLQKELTIHHSPKHPVFRKIAMWSLQEPLSVFQETLYIRDIQENYTEIFKNLLKDFYLAF